MKNIFKTLAAVALIAMTAACSKDGGVAPVATEKATVSFDVQLPGGIVGRATNDGTTATELHYAVYLQNEDGSNTYLFSTNDGDIEVEDMTNKSGRVELNLVSQQTYDIVFWAQAPEAYTPDFAAGKVAMEYDYDTKKAGSNESRDAFVYVWNNLTVNGAINEPVTLKRPFAQLNIGLSDGQIEAADLAGFTLDQVKVKALTYNEFSFFAAEQGAATGDVVEVEFAAADYVLNPETITVAEKTYDWVSFNYLLAKATSVAVPSQLIDVTVTFTNENATKTIELPTFTNVPVERNHRTNIVGDLLTDPANFNVSIDETFEDESEHGVIEGESYSKVGTAEELAAAITNGVETIILNGDITLNDLVSRNAADPSLTIAAGKTQTIDLNGKKLSAISTQTGKNYNMINVRGTLTVKNGSIEYKHEGENMGWNNSTNIFDVTAGGVLNIEDVTAKNLGGSDMGFVAHLNNWGEVTLNVENSTLESNYVPVRVFNSGPNKNNVDIKNSTLKGGSYAFWVHNYTEADYGSAAKAEAQQALLNLNIYNQGNTFSPDLNGIRYGFTNSVKTDAYGITKEVSEDGTVVTLGSIVENGLIRRGVAGAEENTTIKKVIVEEGVGVLYDRTFRRFYALEEVVLPNTLTTIGAAGSGVFQSCSNLKTIVIPESVTVLGKGTFQECAALESINIPAGVTRIESDCLRNTGLKEVEFHAGVTYFGAQAFRDCKQLTKVTINAPEFTMEGNTFGIMAAPYTPMTLEVANAEMKAYAESKLTAHAKTYITVITNSVADSEESLAEAFAKGGYVTLVADITVAQPVTIPAEKEVVLNLNGKTIKAAAEQTQYAIANLGTLTLTGNGTVVARGIYNGYDNGVEHPTAKLIVENGTYNAMGTNGGAAIFNYGEVEIKNGTFTSVGGYSLNNQAGAKMTIHTATVTGGIYNVGEQLTIHAGDIATNRGGYLHAIYHAGGDLIVNGGSFKGNGNEVINANSSVATINGGTFQKVEKTSYLLAGSKMTINDGMFLAHESNPAGHPVRPDVIVKGGTFNYKHTNIAAGYKIVDNGNGTWTVVAE